MGAVFAAGGAISLRTGGALVARLAEPCDAYVRKQNSNQHCSVQKIAHHIIIRTHHHSRAYVNKRDGT